MGRVSNVAHDRLRSAVVGELALRLANQVIEAGAAHGIVFMPLKGVLLLARWPALRGRRTLVDVDLLVRASDEATAVRVLRELGFDATVGSSAGMAFANEAWPLSIDLHRELFPHGLFRASTDGVFSRAELDRSLFSGPVARMSNEDLFAHLIGHFVKGRGRFAEDKSLDDLQWLLKQGVFRLEDAARLGAHLRALGLQRAAAYVLADESFGDDPIAVATLRALELSRADRIVIAAARSDMRWNRDAPRWWTPHLLDRSLVAGSGSLLWHAAEGLRRHLGRHAVGRS